MRRASDRWTEMALFLGGLMWVAVWALRAAMPVSSPDESRPGGEVFDLRVVASLALVAVGMTGVQSLRAKQTGRPGSVSLGLIWVGMALMATWVLELVDVYPMFILGGMTILGGTILFAIVPLRTKALPPKTMGPLIAASVLFVAVNPENWLAYLALPLGLAWIWLAYFERRARVNVQTMSE